MFDMAISCDFAAIMKYIIAQGDVNVTGCLSYDLRTTTETVKSLRFGREDIEERHYVLRRGEDLPRTRISTPGELKQDFLEHIEMRGPS